MATTKKSTKAKTNTTKAKTPTKKPVVKKVAAKANAARTKKAVVAKSSKPTPQKAFQGKYVTLRKLNQLSAFLHIAGAVGAAFLMGNASVQIFTGLMARDELASNTSTVFVPAIHHLYDVEIRWALVAILVLAAIVPLVNILREARYQAAVKLKSVPLRWADKAIVSGAMLAVVAALSGVQDFMTLKVIGGLIVVTAALGWLAERQNTDAKAESDKSAYAISLVSGALPWLMVLAFAFGTPLWGMIRYPWYVYALYATVFISSAAYAINGYNYLRRFRNWTKYEVVERNYIIIDILARVSFAAILIIGLTR